MTARDWIAVVRVASMPTLIGLAVLAITLVLAHLAAPPILIALVVATTIVWGLDDTVRQWRALGDTDA